MLGTRQAAVALLAAAAVGAGCGGDNDDDTSDTRRTPTATKSSASTMPPAQYADEFGQIVTRIQDARSAYFHGGNSRTDEREQLSALRRAHVSGVAQLEAIEPPPSASDLHGRALDVMRRRAAQLQELVQRDGYDRARASDLLAAMDRDGGTYEEIYSLPR